jgi:hypothetical protein
MNGQLNKNSNGWLWLWKKFIELILCLFNYLWFKVIFFNGVLFW